MNRDKKKLLKKFCTIMNEFKLMAVMDYEKKEWTPETTELLDYLAFGWNTYCFDRGYYKHGPLFLIETKIIKGILLNDGSEAELRKRYDNIKN